MDPKGRRVQPETLRLSSGDCPSPESGFAVCLVSIARSPITTYVHAYTYQLCICKIEETPTILPIKSSLTVESRKELKAGRMRTVKPSSLTVDVLENGEQEDRSERFVLCRFRGGRKRLAKAMQRHPIRLPRLVV